MKSVLLVAVLVAAPVSASAQKIVSGTVRDAKSDKPLPGANIFVLNTYTGTITNREGAYSLSIPDSLLPATIRVSYIGYHTVERTITKQSSNHQNFNLKRSVQAMHKLVITGGGNPGMSIMRKVIERKEKWRNNLHSYIVTAYSRQNLSSDTTMVMISEEVSKAFWSKKKGIREIVKWHHQTANLGNSYIFLGLKFMPNFYDDNIKIAGFNLVGITNPNAFKYYKFKLIGQLSRDGQTVYHIKVIPKKDLQPLFKGSVYVLDKKFALLKVTLKPNSVVRFPAPIKNVDLAYRQTFNNFGGPFWLPVDVRISGSLKISMIGLHFPAMNFNRLVSISNYKINVPLPDSLYKNSTIVYTKSIDVPRDSLVEKFSVKPIPLSHVEKHAYATVDSTQTLAKEFQPSGFLAKFIDITTSTNENSGSGNSGNSGNNTSEGSEASAQNEGFHIPGHLWPLVRYDRVDGLFAGLKYSHNIWNGLGFTVRGGYSTAPKIGSYGVKLGYSNDLGRFSMNASAGYQVHNPTQYHSQILTPILTAIPNFLGDKNYFDYFREKAWTFSVGITDSKTNLSLRAGFKTANQTSLQTNTGYDIMGIKRIPRINPAINEGHLNALTFTAGYNLDKDYTLGVLGRKRIAFNVTISNPALGSDFTFKKYSAHIDWEFVTFFKRRLFPNTLNISLDAGTYSGRLPLQEMGIVDVAPGIISPFGALRAARSRPFEGSSFITLNVEHDFRTVPFELLGLNFLVRHDIGLIAFGGVAKTWLSRQRKQHIFNRTGYAIKATDGVHLEAGLSLTGIFDLFRVDFAKGINEPVFLVGISLTRFR